MTLARPSYTVLTLDATVNSLGALSYSCQRATHSSSY